MRYKIPAWITVEGETYPIARNKALKILAQAELDGKIERGDVGNGWRVDE